MKYKFFDQSRSKIYFRNALSVTILSSLLSTTQASDYSVTCEWVAGNGNWEDSSRWSDCGGSFPGGKPIPYIGVVKNERGEVTLNQRISLNSLTLGSGTIRGGSISTEDDFYFTGGTLGTGVQNYTNTRFTGGTKTLSTGHVLTGGLARWSGGDFVNHATGKLTNSGMHSLFDIQTDADFINGTFTNGGILFKSIGATDGSDSTRITGKFNNSRSVSVGQGVLELNGGGDYYIPEFGGSENGTIQFGGGTHVFHTGGYINGELTVRVVAGTIIVTDSNLRLETFPDSTFDLSGGTIRGSGDINMRGLFRFTGGTLGGGGGTVTARGGMQLSGGTKTLKTGNLVNTGSALWMEGDFDNLSTGQLTNAVDATFEIRTDADFINGTFTNEGTLTKSAGTSDGNDSTRITGDFKNSGVVNVAVGNLMALSTIDQKGTLRVAKNAVFFANSLLNQGLITGEGVVEVTSSLGLINSNRIAPGDDGIGGMLKVDGNYFQTEEGTLEVELGGTQGDEFDMLHIVGDFTLDGDLEVSLTAGYRPEIGDIFTILTSDGSRLFDSEFDSILSVNPAIEFSTIYGSDFVQLSVSQVPIPAAVWLFGSALLGLFGVSGKNKAGCSKTTAF